MVAIAYLVASVFFILSLSGLSAQATARRGNAFGIAGMAIAIAATIPAVANVPVLLGAMVVGGAIGAVLARLNQATTKA